ncbi:MAG: DUF4167 domain-containing protein [Paracoccaceae bacterium]
MRPSNKSRSRNKNSSNRRNVGNVVNRVFDSAGPEGKVRGTPAQIIEKYNNLARDAQLSGDRVASENFLQHSEHYCRVLSEAQRLQAERAQAERTQHETVQNAHPQPESKGVALAPAPAQESPMTTFGDQPPAEPGGLVDTPENTRPRKSVPRRSQRRPRVDKAENKDSAAEPQATAAPDTPAAE